MTYTPESLGARIDALGANGHSWMDGPTMLALASQPTSDAQMLTQASALTSAAQQQTASTPAPAYSPTDLAPISAQNQLVNTTHSLVGAPRLSLNDLSGIQSSLVSGGYGKGLNPDGVWNPDWQAAYTQFASDAKARYLQGEGQIGTERTKSVLKQLIDGLSAGTGIGSLWGFVKSLPHDIRQAASDVTGAVEGTASLLGREVQGAFTGTAYSGSGQKSIFGSAEHDAMTGAGFVEGKTAEREHANFTDANGNWDWGRVAGQAVDDIGTALLFIPVVGEVGVAAKGGLLLGKEAADVGLKGVVTRLVTRSAPENAIRTPGVIAKTLLGDGAQRAGLLNREAVANIPVLGKVGPALTKIGPEYYRLRTMLAQPYATPLVQAVGSTGSRLILKGAEARAVGLLSQGVGGDPNNPLNYNVTHTTIDPSILHLGFLKPFGLDNGLNDLGLLLHPKIGTSEGSKVAADQIQSAYDHISRMQGGVVDPLGAYQRAVALATRKPVDYADLIANFGSEEKMLDFVRIKMSQHSAAMQAEREMLANPDAPSSAMSAEGQAWIHDRADQILSDPVAMSEAWAHAAADSESSRLTANFWREMVNSQTDLEHAAGHGGSAWMDNIYGLRAVPRDELITPEAHAQRQTEIDAQAPFDPNYTGTKPQLSVQFIRDNNLNTDRGRIGLARTTSWTTQDVQRLQANLQKQYGEFQERLANAATPEAQQRIAAEQTSWLHENIGEIGKQTNTDAGVLSKLLSTASGDVGFTQMMDLLESKKQMLASEVFPAMGASAQTKAYFARLKAEGKYKVVYGKGIGHAAEMPVDYGDLGKALNARQRLFGSLLLSTERTSQLTAGAMARIGVVQEIQRLMDKGLLPSVTNSLITPKVLLHIAEQGFAEQPAALQDLTVGQRTAMAVASPLLKRQIRADLQSQGQTTARPGVVQTLTHGRFGSDVQKGTVEAESAAMESMRRTMLQGLGMRDWRRGAAVDALTDPQRYPWLTVGEDGLRLKDGTVPGTLSVEDAHKVVDAVIRGYSYRPGYLLGGQHLEDLFRAPMGFLGQKWGGKAIDALYAHPGILTSSVLGLARLPNRYYQTMSRLRFGLSPMFDLRRVAKTNVKFGLAGIRPTVDPAHALLSEFGEQGYRDAHALLDKALPEHAVGNNPWIDANDQILAQNSVYGLFNPRHFAAWAAHEMSLDGKSLNEIRDTILKTTTYGDRTAMERTANTVFFPFSFDKTLYRSVGGYLLDHPSQSMVMLRAFQAYDQFSQNHGGGDGHWYDIASYKWWQEHAPIINELSRLNAFEHGVGPGQFGGINAPAIQALQKAFLPQSLPANAASNAVLTRMFPAWHDLSRVVKEAQETGVDTWHGFQQGMYQAGLVMGNKATPLNAPPSAVAPQYALTDALTYKRQLSDALKTTLEYNRKHPDAKYAWPNSDQVPQGVRNQPIDATTINLVVQHRYPSFNPVKAVEIAEKRREALTTVLGQHADDPGWSGIASFAKQVNSLAVHVRDDNRTPQALAAAASKLRDYAISVGKDNPDFQTAYAKFFLHILGPIDWSNA